MHPALLLFKNAQSLLCIGFGVLLYTTTAICEENGDLLTRPATNVGKLVSVAGMNFILDQEVSCSIEDHGAYDRHYRHPEWPEGDSGITIAIGYDLGFEETFEFDWQTILHPEDYDALKAVCGLSGARARARLSDVATILIEWKDAYQVFDLNQLPREYIKTARMFPGLQDLTLNAQSALVSLEYNRGTSLIGPSRREMREIRDLVPSKDYSGIATQLVAMDRVWRGSSIEDDMVSRRAGEARLVATP